jgi:hypothetical protein
MDVKSNLRDELFIAITESKKTRETEGGEQVYERHKVFLYPEDFERFMESLEDVLSYARRRNKETGRRVEGGEYGY